MEGDIAMIRNDVFAFSAQLVNELVKLSLSNREKKD
jgi:hypothetical protein